MTCHSCQAYHQIGCSFTGARVAQCPGDFWVWETVLHENPFSRIMELGTAYGIFSCYLLMHCLHRGAEFQTIDTPGNPFWWNSGRKHSSGGSVIEHNNGRVIERLGLKDHYVQVDAFSPEGTKIIRDFVSQDGPSILFCDNGNKPREAKLFAPFLKVGDLLVVHDWKSEFYEIDIPPVVRENFEPLQEVDDKSATKFWKRTI